MSKKRGAAIALIAVVGLPLTACTAPTPLEAGTQKCRDSVEPEIKGLVTEPDSGWANATIKTNVKRHESHDGSDYAYDIYGTAEIQVADETVLTVEWECFTQTADDKTYANVRINAN